MKRIIDKAVEGGYWFPDIPKDARWETETYNRIGVVQLNWSYSKYALGMRSVTYEQIIFSHGFLKAFFGEDTVIMLDDEGTILDEWEDWMNVAPGYGQVVGWMYHAEKLVLSEDRIKYLEGFLE